MNIRFFCCSQKIIFCEFLRIFFMVDERLLVILKQRSTGCTLRKQPQELTRWFYEALDIYGKLWVRPDKDQHPVKSYINQLFTLLKFVALPNTPSRKKGKIEQKWPELRDKISSL
jgi:hypothetical protein